MELLTGTTTPSQIEPKEVIPIKTGASPSAGLLSYPGHLLVGVLPLYRDSVNIFYSPS